MHSSSYENDLPVVEIEIGGLNSGSKILKAIVDTGNNGYLTLPYIEAFPLGLVLLGMQSSTLADGGAIQSFVCQGTVGLPGQAPVLTVIDIQPSCPILIGNKLLKLLRKRLEFDPAAAFVKLTDSDKGN